MLVGYLLKSKTPDGLLNTLAFVIFAIFGIYTAYQALNLISEKRLSDHRMAASGSCYGGFRGDLCLSLYEKESGCVSG